MIYNDYQEELSFALIVMNQREDQNIEQGNIGKRSQSFMVITKACISMGKVWKYGIYLFTKLFNINSYNILQISQIKGIKKTKL